MSIPLSRLFILLEIHQSTNFIAIFLTLYAGIILLTISTQPYVLATIEGEHGFDLEANVNAAGTALVVAKFRKREFCSSTGGRSRNSKSFAPIQSSVSLSVSVSLFADASRVIIEKSRMDQ